MIYRKLTKCDCGFGEGFYHYGHDSFHEFNPNISEDQATTQYQDDRKPIAVFFGHMDGRRTVLHIYAFPGAVLKRDISEFSFFYNNHGGNRKEAFAAAAKFTLSHTRQIKLL